MSEKMELSSSGGSESLDNGKKKKSSKASKKEKEKEKVAQQQPPLVPNAASPRRVLSPRFAPTPPEVRQKKPKKLKTTKSRDHTDDDDTATRRPAAARGRDRSQSLDYSALSEISKATTKTKATTTTKTKHKSATRDGRSASVWEGPPSSAASTSTSSSSSPSTSSSVSSSSSSSAKIGSSKSSTSSSSSASKRSSSVRNALTCFIPHGKESAAADDDDDREGTEDGRGSKKKVGAMIILAADAQEDESGGSVRSRSEDESGSCSSSGKKKRKGHKKKGELATSASGTSLSLPSSPVRATAPASTVHHHRFSGGMTFSAPAGEAQGAGAKSRRRGLSALESMEYNNVVVVANNGSNGTNNAPAIPVSSSSPSLGGGARASKKNTLSPHMRSSSDRFSYNSKHNKEKLNKTGRPKERNSNEIGGRSSGLARESRRESLSSVSSSSSSSGDEDHGKKKGAGKKRDKKEKKDRKDNQHQQQHHQLGSSNSKLTASMSWRGKKTSRSQEALGRPDLKEDMGINVPAPGYGTQIVISPRKPAPEFPKSKQRLSFSGWLTHFNVQLNPGTAAAATEPKRKYKEGTVEGFLEDIQLDEHVNELIKVRGISSMERLFEVTVQQFYDMDIPTSDLRLLIEEINKRKNPPPPPPVVVVEPAPSELDKVTTTESHNNSNAAEHPSAADGDMEETKTAKAARQNSERAVHGAALLALEQRLGEEADRRARAEQEKAEAMRALEAEKQRVNDMERKLEEALSRIHAMEQSLSHMATAASESTKKKAKTKTKTKKTKTKAKAKKETRQKTPRATGVTPPDADLGGENAAKVDHDDVHKAKEAGAESGLAGSVADKTTQQMPVQQPRQTEEEAEAEEEEGVVQYHYPLPIRVPSARVNRLSTRLLLKVKSPSASPRGASPRTAAATANSSEGRMRQAEKETFEQKQNDIRHWIEAATKESFPVADFFQSLRSGVLLCKLLNFISPGIIKEVHAGDMAFYQLENITYFVEGCRKLGVKTTFDPADLYHGKNLEAVLSCLDALDRWTRRSTTYRGPYLVRSTSHSQFIRSLSGKLLLDKDAIAPKKTDSSPSSSSGELRPLATSSPATTTKP